MYDCNAVSEVSSQAQSKKSCAQADVSLYGFNKFYGIVIILSFRTYKSGQTVQTQIKLLLEEQSDQGLHCLLFHYHLYDLIP